MKLSSTVGALSLALGLLASAADLPPLSHSMSRQSSKVAAPVLKLKDLDGKSHDLAELKGKVVLVHFWETWCPPCRREMPSMDRLARKFSGENFVVLAVDVGEDVDTIHSFFSQLDTVPSFPILLDQSGATMQTWKIAGLPMTYLIDADGRVAYSAVGGREFDHPEIEKLVRTFLKY